MRGCAALLMTLLLCGCAGTLTGVEGKSGFSCKAPDGVVCSSLSGVYANAAADNLPSQQSPVKVSVKPDGGTRAELPLTKAPSSGEPIRSQPTLLRLWLAPWEDAEGDLHDQSYVYVMADPGRWLIERQHKQIIDRYRPVFVRPTTSATAPASAGSATSSASGAMVFPGNESRAPAAPSGGGPE